MMQASRSRDTDGFGATQTVLSVDTLDSVRRALVTAASVSEREGGKQVPKRVQVHLQHDPLVGLSSHAATNRRLLMISS